MTMTHVPLRPGPPDPSDTTKAHQRAVNAARRKRNEVIFLFSKGEKREQLFNMVAEGRPLTKIASRFGVDYGTLMRLLTTKYAEEYAIAKEMNSERLVEQNLQLAQDVIDGRVEPAAAKVASGIRQWYAERASNKNWGNKSAVDLNVKGTVGLHMEALRKVMEEPIDGEYVEVPQEETSSDEDDDTSGHPLL